MTRCKVTTLIFADAKYIPLDGFDSTGNDEKATAIYYKTITYMYRFNSKIGLLLYPLSDNDTDRIMPYKILGTEGQVIKVGFPIPMHAATFSEFSETMRINEVEYRRFCKEYIEGQG